MSAARAPASRTHHARVRSRVLSIGVTSLLLVDCTNTSSSTVPRVVSTEFILADEPRIGRIIDADRDPQTGQIVLADDLNRAVWIVDPVHRSITQLGRRGAGPGEFEDVTSLAVAPDGRIAVFDYRLRRLQFFSPTGSVLDVWSIPYQTVSPAPISIDHSGTVYIRDSEIGGRDPYWHIVSSDGRPRNWKPPYPYSLDPAQENGGGLRISVPGAPNRLTAVGPNGELAYGDGRLYRVFITSDVGGVDSLGLDAETIEYTREQRTRVNERIEAAIPPGAEVAYEVPDLRAHYSDLAFGQDGRLWVRVVMAEELSTRVGDAPTNVVWDVFDGAKHVGRFSFPPRTWIKAMAGDSAWGVIPGPFDESRLAKFVLPR